MNHELIKLVFTYIYYADLIIFLILGLFYLVMGIMKMNKLTKISVIKPPSYSSVYAPNLEAEF